MGSRTQISYFKWGRGYTSCLLDTALSIDFDVKVLLDTHCCELSILYRGSWIKVVKVSGISGVITEAGVKLTAPGCVMEGRIPSNGCYSSPNGLIRSVRSFKLLYHNNYEVWISTTSTKITEERHLHGHGSRLTQNCLHLPVPSCTSHSYGSPEFGLD